MDPSLKLSKMKFEKICIGKYTNNVMILKQ